MTRKKKFFLAGSLVLLIVCALLLSGYAIRPALEFSLRNNGFPEAQIESANLIPEGLLVEGIALDGNGFSTIEALQAKLSWIDFATSRKISSIIIKNAELSGELAADGSYVIAGWDASPASGGDDDGLDIESMSVEGLTLDLETDQGAIRIEGKLDLQNLADQSRDFQASLWGRQKQLSLSANSTGKIQPDGSWTAQIELLEGRFDMGPFKTSRASGTVNLKKSPDRPVSYKGRIVAGGLRLNDTPFQDLNLDFDSAQDQVLSFSVSPTGYDSISIAGSLFAKPEFFFNLTISAKKMDELGALSGMDKETQAHLSNLVPLTALITVPMASLTTPKIEAAWKLNAGSDQLKLKGTAKYDKESETLSGELASTSAELSKLSALLSEETRKVLSLTDGTATLSGDFSYVKGTPSLDGKLRLEIKNAGGLLQTYPFSSVGGTLTADRIWPWRLEKSQTVKVGTVGTGLNLTDGKIVFTGEQTKGISVQSAKFNLADGNVSLQPFLWSPKAKSTEITLTLDNLDMNMIADNFDNDGFSASGRLSGSLPLMVSKKDGMKFKQGKISSSDGGYFRYKPTVYPAALQGDDSRLKTVREALSNFQFTAFEVAIDGDLKSSLKTNLKAVGRNPGFSERPINLNINLEGALMPALQQALQPGRIADTIEQSIQNED